MKQSTEKVGTTNPTTDKKGVFIFQKENYYIMFIGLALIMLGGFLMSGSEDIFSATKIKVAPVVMLLGFAVEIYAILHRPKNIQK